MMEHLPSKNRNIITNARCEFLPLTRTEQETNSLATNARLKNDRGTNSLESNSSATGADSLLEQLQFWAWDGCDATDMAATAAVTKVVARVATVAVAAATAWAGNNSGSGKVSGKDNGNDDGIG